MPMGGKMKSQRKRRASSARLRGGIHAEAGGLNCQVLNYVRKVICKKRHGNGAKRKSESRNLFHKNLSICIEENINELPRRVWHSDNFSIFGVL